MNYDDGHGLFTTEKEFCLILNDDIIGPMPGITKFCNLLLSLVENIEDKPTRLQIAKKMAKEMQESRERS